MYRATATGLIRSVAALCFGRMEEQSLRMKKTETLNKSRGDEMLLEATHKGGNGVW